MDASFDRARRKPDGKTRPAKRNERAKKRQQTPNAEDGPTQHQQRLLYIIYVQPSTAATTLASICLLPLAHAEVAFGGGRSNAEGAKGVHLGRALERSQCTVPTRKFVEVEMAYFSGLLVLNIVFFSMTRNNKMHPECTTYRDWLAIYKEHFFIITYCYTSVARNWTD